MKIVTSYGKTSELLDMYKVSYKVSMLPNDVFEFDLAPGTKWQVFTNVALQLGPCELDVETNVLHVDDEVIV